MKHKLISCISVLLVVLITFGTGAFSAATLDTSTEVSSKISPDLQSKLSEMSNDDTVEVAVWLNHTDEETLKNAYKNELQKSINRGIITTDIATATALFDESSNLEIEPLSIEKTQQLLSIRRSSYSNIIIDNNNKWKNDTKNTLNKKANIIYTSRYVPLVVLQITKSDVYNLALSNEVQYIYAYETILPKIDSSTDSYLSQNARSVSDYGPWQDITGITEMHDGGYSGDGIRIGLYDAGSPALNHNSNVFVNSNMEAAYYDDAHSHATYMASILVGKTDDYVGVAPDATLVYAGYKGNYFGEIESLIDCDINVLSLSFFVLSGTYNAYGIYSKFLDYISYTYNILVCVAASNYSNTPQGIPDTAMSYNAITVGNIDDNNTLTKNDDVLSDDSCYVEYYATAYKPDVCAPGARASTASSPNVHSSESGYGGTSAATPIVAGISALLMGADSRLVGRPGLVKSIIMSSAERLINMDEVYSTPSSTTPALSRSYGAGLVNATNALELVENNNQWRCIEIQSVLASQDTYTMNLSVSQNNVNSSMKVAVCLTWLKRVTSNDSGSSIVYNVTDYNLFVKNGNNIVASSTYQCDNKQFIYFEPTVSGTYKIIVEKNNSTNSNTPIAFSYYLSN